MLDTRIKTFLKVCEYMNYTKAAQVLNLTQPAVSKHIQYLEEYYGVKLFEYHNRRLTLTAQGAYLKNVMNAMRHDAMRIQEDIAHLNQRKRIKLGATLSIGNFYLPQPLISFLKQHPEIDISVTIADTEELLRRLDAGELSFILCEGNFSKSDYDYQLLKHSCMAVFCGRDYNIEGIREFQDLFSHRVLLREKGSGTREIFEHFLMEHGYSIGAFASWYEINSAELILKMLQENVGVSVLYQDVGAALLKEGKLKTIPLSNFQLEHEFNAVWAKGSSHGEEYRSIIRELQKA